MSTRAVITGAARHLGFHVAQAAVQQGFEVELLITSRNSNIDRLLNVGAHFTVVNFDDRATFRRHLEWADVLFHVAPPHIGSGELTSSELNSGEPIQSSERVLNAAVAAGVPRIVFTSSANVLGDNRDPSRLLSEQDRPGLTGIHGNSSHAPVEQVCDRLIRDHGVDLRRLYPAWLLGPADTRGSFEQRLLRNYLRHGQWFSFDGGVSLNAVEEAGRAHVSAALAAERCGTYVLGGENVSLPWLYAELAALSGRPAPRFRLPSILIPAQGGVSQALRLMTGQQSTADPNPASRLAGLYRWYDSSKAQRDLNYQIRPARDVLEAGILMERKRAAGVNVLFHRPASRHTSISSPEPQTAPPILLTGVPGWLGNRFVDILMNGDRTGLRYPPRRVHLLLNARHLPLFDLPENFHLFASDLPRPSDLSRALDGVHTVFHLQEATAPKHIETLYQVNTEGTKNLADECIRAGVRRLLYVSSDAVCSAAGHRLFDENTPPLPLDDYGRSKLQAEEYLLEKCRAGLLDVTILRQFWTFGPFAPARQERFFASLRQRRQVIFGDGQKLRSVSHVDNTIHALLAAEHARTALGKTYWIGDEKPDYTVDEIHALLCEAMVQPYRPFYVPAQACQAARLANRLLRPFGRLLPSGEILANGDRDRAGRVDAAQRDFGYRPVISFPDYTKELARRGRPEPVLRKAYAG